ncbi:MAG TPA: cyclic nucleotide-binding domain-containing protein [candidate division WOR-3 bacterium]|uniref:Cyclic nucleotide-binding domain-containing protein n=1 Tax=candidate division WOR-3 bacterium TaxID=2052148 RepID=A0A9C9JZM8_UNCW3|nr:cyclic nucleotide-binding domain-containing protein [candidate division WOR-3 bacterium]
MIDKEQLQKTGLFGELKEMEWEELLKIVKEKEFVEGDIVFSEGDVSTEFYMLFKGEVEIQIKIAPQLGESTVYIVRPYDVFGEFAFVDPKSRSATARCTKNSTLGIIHREDFKELVERFPRVGLNFYHSLVRLLCERLRRMNTYMRDTFVRCAGLEI